MAKQNAAARRKAARRVKKNVERGQATLRATHSAGQVQAVLDSKVQGNLLPTQLRWQLRQLPRLHRFMD